VVDLFLALPNFDWRVPRSSRRSRDTCFFFDFVLLEFFSDFKVSPIDFLNVIVMLDSLCVMKFLAKYAEHVEKEENHQDCSHAHTRAFWTPSSVTVIASPTTKKQNNHHNQQ
jgi:hypothetical protein